MDEGEAMMEVDAPQDRFSNHGQLLEKVIESPDDFGRAWRDVRGATDPDLLLPILTRGLKRPSGDHLVEALEEAVVELQVRSGPFPDPVERLRVVRRLEVLAHALPADRDGLLQDEAGLLECERVALDRIAVIGMVEAKLLSQPFEDIRWEGPAGPQHL